MRVFEWNGVRVDDHVAVHVGADLRLAEGVVGPITRTAGARPNHVGVRLEGGRVVWPAPGAVHAVLRADDAADCWRCRFVRAREPEVRAADR
jgi:hypothetical protein